MTDYSELVKALRICCKGSCVDCDRQRQYKCLKRHWNNEDLIDGMLCEAAAAIEDMAKHITEMHERVTVLQIARGELEAEVEKKRTADCWGCKCEKVEQAASPWHGVEEPPKDGQECIVAYSGPTDWIYEHATYHSDLNKALEEDIFIEGTDGFIVDGDVGYARHDVFKYWMPIEPPKEDA